MVTGAAGRNAGSSYRLLHALLATRTASYGSVGLLLTSLIVFWGPLHRLMEFAAHSEYSYIPIVPAISAFLIVERRGFIFRDGRVCPGVGGVMIAIGILLSLLVRVFPRVTAPNSLSLAVLGIVTTWWGLFIVCYGLQAARKAMVPLCLLLFMIPAPQHLTDAVIALLQHESAALSYSLFRMIGVPAIRDGMTLSLPHLTIEVAPECSGIRSTLSLLILTLAGANLYLRHAYNKSLLILLLVPLSILKNAIRIVTLTTLALYVDPTFLSGPLHHRGGILFFFLSFTMLVPVVIMMRRCERES
jgi:exosortase